jgi:hypothetical protein
MGARLPLAERDKSSGQPEDIWAFVYLPGWD